MADLKVDDIELMNEDKEEWYILRTEEWKEICETLLKALEEYEKQLDLEYVDNNYVPKEKVRKIIEDIDETDAGDYIDAIQDLQELLGE